MTPLERMNLRYPNMKLHHLPESQRELFGEPDLDVCLRYYRKVMAAIKSDGNEPVLVLSEFLRCCCQMLAHSQGTYFILFR